MAGRKRGGASRQDRVAEAQLRASFERRFEGLAVLDGCLEKAGATYTAEEVLEEFAGASAQGATADEVIPLLFHDAPVVADAAQARRLFSNLFGAWDAAAGDAPAARIEPLADGDALPTSFVEASWRATDLLSPAELRSQWDRFSQTQGDALTFLTTGCRRLPDEAFDTAATATFEMWRAFVAARPDRVAAAPLQIRALEAWATRRAEGAGGGPLEAEPALADFAAEALEIAQGEGLQEASELAGLLGAIRSAMAEAWQ